MLYLVVTDARARMWQWRGTVKARRCGDRIGSDLRQASGKDRLDGWRIEIGEKDLADRAAVERRPIADLEVHSDALMPFARKSNTAASRSSAE